MFNALVVFSIVAAIPLSSAKNCTCVPFYQCSDDYTIISDGRGLIELRNSQQCEGFLNVCCTVVSSTTTENPVKKPKGCGFQNHETFPWSGALLFKQYPNFVPSYKCRVSLINEKVAITAAHCLQEKGYYQVKISSTLRTVINIQIHPSFTLETLQNDIAVLFLNKAFRMDKIGTVCIPPPGTVLDGSNCTTATQEAKKGASLKVVDLPVVNDNECTGKLRETRLGKHFILHQSFICAGGNNVDTCEGDGGSPLICPVPGVPGRYQQAGIVSWGIGCEGDVPGVYVNLAYFRDWIDDVMVKNSVDTQSYRI